MKFFKALTVGITASSLICSLAYAQDETTTATKTTDVSSISKMFKSFDTDGDGKIAMPKKQPPLLPPRLASKRQWKTTPN